MFWFEPSRKINSMSVFVDTKMSHSWMMSPGTVIFEKNKRRENTIEYDMSLIGMVLKNAFSSAYASQHFHHIFSRLNCSFSADKIVTLKPDLSWLSHFSLTKNTVRHATVQTKINELHFSLFCSVLLPVEIESMSLRSKIVLSSLFSHSLFFIWFSLRSASFAKSI